MNFLLPDLFDYPETLLLLKKTQAVPEVLSKQPEPNLYNDSQSQQNTGKKDLILMQMSWERENKRSEIYRKRDILQWFLKRTFFKVFLSCQQLFKFVQKQWGKMKSFSYMIIFIFSEPFSPPGII